MLKCLNCSKELTAVQVKSGGKFCSHRCCAIFNNLAKYPLESRKLPGGKSWIARFERAIATLPFEELGDTWRRRIVLQEQGCKCGKCGISDWLGKPLTLELDHKDGNKHNWQRENLIYLCPNCHSQTLTWRGRKNVMGSRSKRQQCLFQTPHKRE